MGNKITRRCSTVDERYTRPQGLYPQRDVDQKKLRRLILDSKLAPCFPGEEETSADSEECPICFLYYPSLNRSKCCSKGVCTECFLQMKSPRAARSTQCPFCKSHNYAVEYRGSKTLEEKGIEAAEEQKFIEAKIRMRKQELLDDEEREQRKEESCTTPTTPIDEHDTSRLVELPKSRSNHAQQVKLTPDFEKWKQNLCEPSYCHDQQWLRKPCGPSLTAGPSSFRTCGPHCEPNCSKCLMTFHKRRVYDMLDVITPQSEVLKENRIEPFVGRWRSTWGYHHSPLSRSFPLPSRMPEYHCRHTRILDPEALGHLSLDVPSHPDGLFVCEDQKAQKASNLAQEPVPSGMSDRPSSCDDLDSSWVCEEYGSEGSLAPTPAPQQSIAPLPPSSQPRSGTESATSQHQPGPAPPGYTRHRDDEFDFDLEDIMVMEAIWQSIQDQGMCHRYSVSEPPRMAPNQLADLNTDFQEDAGVGVLSEASTQVVGSGSREHLHQSGRMSGGLASAIAALAEQHAIKGDAIPTSKQTSNIASPSEPEPVDEEVELAVEADAIKSVSENCFSGRCDKAEVVSGKSDLHAMAVTLASGSASGSFLVSSSCEAEQSDVSMDSCCDDQSSQPAEDGGSTSAHGAYSNDALCVAPVNSPVVTVNRCATDANGKVMLPKSFEEQMMLAMALSLADAQFRARLEDSHPRPLGQRIFELDYRSDSISFHSFRPH